MLLFSSPWYQPDIARKDVLLISWLLNTLHVESSLYTVVPSRDGQRSI